MQTEAYLQESFNESQSPCAFSLMGLSQNWHGQSIEMVERLDDKGRTASRTARGISIEVITAAIFGARMMGDAEAIKPVQQSPSMASRNLPTAVQMACQVRICQFSEAMKANVAGRTDSTQCRIESAGENSISN